MGRDFGAAGSHDVAIIAVEYMKPLTAKVAANGAYAICDWCASSFNTALHVTLHLLLFLPDHDWRRLGHGARPLS